MFENVTKLETPIWPNFQTSQVLLIPNCHKKMHDQLFIICIQILIILKCFYAQLFWRIIDIVCYPLNQNLVLYVHLSVFA